MSGSHRDSEERCCEHRNKQSRANLHKTSKGQTTTTFVGLSPIHFECYLTVPTRSPNETSFTQENKGLIGMGGPSTPGAQKFGDYARATQPSLEKLRTSATKGRMMRSYALGEPGAGVSTSGLISSTRALSARSYRALHCESTSAHTGAIW